MKQRLFPPTLCRSESLVQGLNQVRNCVKKKLLVQLLDRRENKFVAGLTVSFLKDKHGAKSHGSDTASANVDAKGLHLLDESSGVLGVKSNVGSDEIELVFVRYSFIGCCCHSPSVLATKVLNQLWVLFSEAFHLLVECRTNASLKKKRENQLAY